MAVARVGMAVRVLRVVVPRVGDARDRRSGVSSRAIVVEDVSTGLRSSCYTPRGNLASMSGDGEAPTGRPWAYKAKGEHGLGVASNRSRETASGH